MTHLPMPTPHSAAAVSPTPLQRLRAAVAAVPVPSERLVLVALFALVGLVAVLTITPWPVGAFQSVSVVAPLAIAAGACATVAMLYPVAEALDFLEAQGVRYLAIDASGQRHTA